MPAPECDMTMQSFVAAANLRRYRALLATELTPVERTRVETLLTEELDVLKGDRPSRPGQRRA
jgi:hypothetical protein